MARFPALNMSAPVASNQADLSYSSVEEVVLMEAKGGGGDLSKLDNMMRLFNMIQGFQIQKEISLINC